MKPRPFRLAAAAVLGAVLPGCISVKTPEKPIEINLNVTIRQEVLVRLQRDVEQLIDQNPDAFPGTAPATPPNPGSTR
jgi:hypothetical protein